MDKNRKEGAKRQASGAVKEGVGKVTGNRSKEVAGTVEKNVGKVQREFGNATDEVRKDRKRD